MLKARDPRNPAHRRAALAILRRHSSVRVTSETKTPGPWFSGDRPDGIMVSDQPRRQERLVARHFLVDEGLVAPDNILVRCAACQTVLQCRPQNLGLAQKYCVFCAADAVLAERQAALRKPRKQP